MLEKARKLQKKSRFSCLEEPSFAHRKAIFEKTKGVL